MTAQTKTVSKNDGFNVEKLPAILTLRLDLVIQDLGQLADTETSSDEKLAIFERVETKIHEQIAKFDKAHKTNFAEHEGEIFEHILSSAIASGMAAA